MSEIPKQPEVPKVAEKRNFSLDPIGRSLEVLGEAIDWVLDVPKPEVKTDKVEAVKPVTPEVKKDGTTDSKPTIVNIKQFFSGTKPAPKGQKTEAVPKVKPKSDSDADDSGGGEE